MISSLPPSTCTASHTVPGAEEEVSGLIFGEALTGRGLTPVCALKLRRQRCYA